MALEPEAFGLQTQLLPQSWRFSVEARLRKVSWGTLAKAAGESMVPYHERHLFRCGKSRAIACCSNLNSFTLSSSRWQVLRGHPGSLALRKKALLSSTNAPGKTKMGAWDSHR